MFTAALFTITKTWKQSKCPATDEQIKKMWYVLYTMEYYSARKKDKIFLFATTWMDPEGMMINEIMQTKTLSIISFICRR